MNKTAGCGPVSMAKLEVVATASPRSLDDPRVIEAVEAYLAALEAGKTPDRRAFLARYPDVAGALAACLDNLEFIQTAAPQLQDAAVIGPADDSPADVSSGVPLGDFRLLREIGRGGMGVVYAAEQLSLNRPVAVKVLPFVAGLDAKQLQRFKNEAQTAGSLHHTNIVPVYAVGCERGVHYYAMQFIDGQSLAAMIQELRQQAGLVADPDAPSVNAAAMAQELTSGHWAPAKRRSFDPDATCVYDPAAELPVAVTTVAAAGATSTDPSTRTPAFFRTVASLGVMAAEALEHAHQLGIVHRDIKPANLLVDGRGNLWITDFGLAHVQSQAGLTMTGDLLGTLRYMSPEQALAKRVIVDHRTDVYSLGATLYELLTLEPVFPGSDRQELLRQIAFEEPRAPRRVNKAIPAELETIVLKALEKNPADRYATAQELADDLTRFLEDRPVLARRPTARQRLAKWVKRHQGLAWAGVVLLAVVAVGSTVSALLVAHQRDLVDAKRKEADQERKTADRERLKAEGERKTAVAARQAAEEARTNALSAAAKAEAINTFLVQSVLGSATAWSETQEQAVIVRVLEGASQNLDQLFAGQPEAEAAVRLTIGELFYSVDQPAKAEPHLRRGLDLRRASRSAPLNPLKAEDAETLYAMKHLGTFIKNRRELAEAEPLLRESQDALRLAEIHRLRCVVTQSGFTINMGHVAFSPDGRRLVASGDDACMRIFDVATGTEIHRFAQGWAGVFSPDGRRMLSMWNKTVRLWDAASGRELRQFRGTDDDALDTNFYAPLVFSPDGRQALASGEDGALRLWDVETGEEVRRFVGHTAAALQAVFTPDGRRILSAGGDKTMRLWEAGTGRELAVLHQAQSAISCVAVAPDGRQALSLEVGALRVWDLESRREIQRILEPTWGFDWVVYAPDGRRALTTNHMHRKMRLWDLEAGTELKCFSLEMPLRPHRAVISPDGRLAACANWRGSVSLWRMNDPPAPGEELGAARQLCENRRRDLGPDHPETVRAADEWAALLLRDGKLAEAGALFRQSLESKRKAFGPEHAETMAAMKILARVLEREGKLDDAEGLYRQCVEGHRAVLGSNHAETALALESLARVLNAQEKLAEETTRRAEIWRIPCVAPEFPFTIDMAHVAFSPDGRRLLASGDDAFMRIFDVATGTEIDRFAQGWAGVFSPDGRRMLSMWNKTVRLWDAASGRRLRQFGGTDGDALDTTFYAPLFFSPDGRQALVSGEDRALRLWNLETGEEVRRFVGHTAAVLQAVFTPDGRQILSAGEDKTMRLWEAGTGRELAVLHQAQSAISCVAVALDGRQALSLEIGALRVWDLESRQEIQRILEPTLGHDWVVYAPDGRRALTTDHSHRKVRLWDLEAGTELKCFSLEMPLRPHRAVISPDGRLVACANSRGSVSLWRMNDPPPPGEELSAARQLCENRRRDLGPDHPKTVRAMDEWAALLLRDGKLAEAGALFRQSLESKRKAFGPEHSETLAAMTILARVLESEGKLDDAEGLYRQCVEGHRALFTAPLASDHADTTPAMDSLARVLKAQEKLAEAEELYRLVVEAARRNLGPENPYRQGAIVNLAELLRARDKAAEAEPLFRESFEWRQKVYPQDHERVVEARYAWGTCLVEKGDVAHGVEVLRQHLEIQRKRLPAGHADLAGALVAFGWALTENGDPHPAEPLLREALTIRRKALPEGDWLIANTESVLGGCLTGRSRFEEAEPLLLSGWNTLHAARGVPPARLRQARDRIIRLYTASGRLEEAVAECQKAIELDPGDAWAHHYLGKALAAQDKPDEAHTAWDEALRLKPDLEVARQTQGLATWHLAVFGDPRWGSIRPAIERTQKAVPKAPQDGELRMILGMLQYRGGDWEPARESLENAISFRSGGDCAEFFFLAMVHWRLGDKARAAEWFDKANRWMEQHNATAPSWRHIRAEAADVLGRYHILQIFEGHTGDIHGMALTSDGSRALTGSFDGTLRLWNVQSAKEERLLTGHTGWVTSVALTPDGKLGLSGSHDQTARLWNMDNGKEIRQFPGHSELIESVALSPDGRLAAAAGRRPVRLWDVETGKELDGLTGDSDSARCVCFSPDSKTVLSGNFDKTLRLWSLDTGKEVQQFQGHSDVIVCVAFSVDGSQILSGSADQTLRLWDTKTGAEVRRFEGHTGVVVCLALSADGRRAASGGEDGKVRVWDLATASELYLFDGHPASFDGHPAHVWTVVFTPDGDRVISSCLGDPTMLLWELPPDLRSPLLKK
jgi:WD40 repeat protein/serine/threonine protein kinase